MFVTVLFVCIELFLPVHVFYTIYTDEFCSVEIIELVIYNWVSNYYPTTSKSLFLF